MIPVTVQTLIVSAAPSPSIIVLQPVEEIVQEGKSRIIPIWVGVNEATQMGIALEKARFSRPMTHDLFLDARPSDALALAVRQKAPIYIVEDVLERASFPYVLRRTEPEASEAELSEFKKFLEGLAPEDFEG